MQKLRFISICAVLTALILSSCNEGVMSIGRENRRITPVSPINTIVNMQSDDLEYVGEVTGSSEQSYVFGSLPIGGRLNHYVVVNQSGSELLSLVPMRRGVRNAVYDALNKKPDADFIIPISYEITIDRMFLGRKEKVNARVKVFRFKTK
ncbi:MAG: hypothetical protein K1X77_09830 [Bacteroidia bacterium]|nr:hypothetical protein [Bacteroidia bacterium]